MANGSSDNTTLVAGSWMSTESLLKLGVGLLLGGLLAYALISSRAAYGDEPPIRVKNGSIELHLLSKNKNWSQPNGTNKKKWKPSAGKRDQRGVRRVRGGYGTRRLCKGDLR